jgi:1-deoxy-D-xylulose-5-phosphate reductoisomerase
MPTPASTTRRVILLGSTGSIGTQTVDVVEHLNRLAGDGRAGPRVRYEVVGLATGKNAGAMLEQARRLGVRDVAIADEGASADFGGVRVRRGASAAERLVREVECDVVLGAMVGSAGLPATMAAVELGRDVALANKETLVAAGELVVPAAQRTGAKLLPVDSEHGALWQCLQGRPAADGTSPPCPPMRCSEEVTRVVLTASGGAFRTWDAAATYNATPEEALKHPTWSMGPKVTIDSASLTNKALEVIEAHWLFGLEGSKIDVLVHPQSLVHAMAEFADGSVIAQLSPPDMRTPIQYALTFPARPAGVSRRLDFAALRTLDFSPPDRGRFPALDLAYRVIERGGTAGAVFNGANEAAVEAFLAREIPFGKIPELSRAALESVGVSPLRTLEDATAADLEARRCVRAMLGR